MADAGAPSNPGQLPPPQAGAGAPGYEAGQNGQPMAPPPLHIPQNTNPIPTAITSPRSLIKAALLCYTQRKTTVARQHVCFSQIPVVKTGIYFCMGKIRRMLSTHVYSCQPLPAPSFGSRFDGPAGDGLASLDVCKRYQKSQGCDVLPLRRTVPIPMGSPCGACLGKQKCNVRRSVSLVTLGAE
jgi:hypothetical protein